MREPKTRKGPERSAQRTPPPEEPNRTGRAIRGASVRTDMSAPGQAPPSDDRSNTAEIVRTLVAAILELMRGIRHEVQRLQDGAEAFLGRVQMAIVRSLGALQRALVATMVSMLFAAAAVVVLTIFLIALLNKYLGDPWGTGLAALILLVVSLAFWMRARANFHTMEVEAAMLMGRGRH